MAKPIQPLTEAEIAQAAQPRDMGNGISISYGPIYLSQITNRRTPQKHATWLESLAARANESRPQRDLIPVSIIVLHLAKDKMPEVLQGTLQKEFQRSSPDTKTAGFLKIDGSKMNEDDLAGVEYKSNKGPTFAAISLSVFEKVSAPEAGNKVFKDFRTNEFLDAIAKLGITQTTGKVI